MREIDQIYNRTYNLEVTDQIKICRSTGTGRHKSGPVSSIVSRMNFSFSSLLFVVHCKIYPGKKLIQRIVLCTWPTVQTEFSLCVYAYFIAIHDKRCSFFFKIFFFKENHCMIIIHVRFSLFEYVLSQF